MKQFIDRLTNVIGNLNSMPMNGYTHHHAIGDIAKISDDLDAYKRPSDMTDQEYKDMQTIFEIVDRHAKEGDGIDHMIVEGAQKMQHVILIRVGGRQWGQMHTTKG